ncbi:MAG: hypothetical protein ACFCAD_09410 [Pleurocapsa sp.]
MSGATSIGIQSPIQAENITISEVTSSESFLHQIANTMNKRLPIMVDRDTRWDASFAGPGKSLSYNYTLVNYSAANIDGSLFAHNAHVLLTERVCNEPTTVIFPQEGVLLNFNYYDNTRNLIARVKVTPSDCGY